MLWNTTATYQEEPFELESDLEKAILEVADTLFGKHRIYLDIKKKIGVKGKTQNIPDGYLIDLTSTKEPKLYVVENELSKHDPLKHIAVQILQFSLSIESSQHRVKDTIKQALKATPEALGICERYAAVNGFDNVDVLLERVVYGEDRFNALVIIDELSPELEKALISRFKFPVEILTLERYSDDQGRRLYRFEPFLSDVTVQGKSPTPGRAQVDPSELDTIVVPAHEDGFNETFIGENRWYAIRIHSSMLSKIKYIAAYRVAPKSAITHVAPVKSIEQWQNSNKYVVNFAEPAKQIRELGLIPKGEVKALQNTRYTSKARLDAATTLEDAF